MTGGGPFDAVLFDFRGTLFDVEDDPRIWDFPHQWLLGDDMLVAPVTKEGARRWSVYLPDGEWVDPYDGTGVTGRAVVECDAPLDRIPVFVAAGRVDELARLFAGDEPATRPVELVEVG